MELNPFFTIKKVLCFMGTNIHKHRHFSYKQVNWKRRILTLCSEIMPLLSPSQPRRSAAEKSLSFFVFKTAVSL